MILHMLRKVESLLLMREKGVLNKKQRAENNVMWLKFENRNLLLHLGKDMSPV
jgi:hypothetical protein